MRAFYPIPRAPRRGSRQNACPMRLITRASFTAVAVFAASAAVAHGQAGPVPASGGDLTMLASSDVDYLDPAHTYYTFGEEVTLATNRPLYSFRPDDALHPVPDLAAADPVVSADKKTVTVSLKPGIRYAPPLNRALSIPPAVKLAKLARRRAFDRRAESLAPAPRGASGTGR